MTITRTNNAGLWIALAAVLVNGPRLVLIFLQADGIAIPGGIEATVLSVTGIATGAVLTGGGMYIAHRLAEPGGGRAVRAILITTWALLLIFSVVLIAPALLLAWRHSALAEIIPAGPDVIWAVVAVLSVEVLAGGAMAAHAMGEQPANQPAQAARRPGRLSILADAVTQRIAGEIASQPTAAAPLAQPRPADHWGEIQPTGQDQPSASPAPARPRRQHRPAPAEPTASQTDRAALYTKHARLIAFLADNPQATDEQMGQGIGRAKSTAQSYRRALEEAGIIHKNGNGWEVADG